MSDDILSYMLVDLDTRRWFGANNQLSVGDSSAGSGWLYRPTGWAIPDDTDHGVSWGGGRIEVGGGVMQMDLQDCRPPPGRRPLYSLWGGYFEIGFPIKGISFGQDFVEKLAKRLRLGRKQPGSDLVILPGGSLGQFVYGPANVRRTPLEIGDFRSASWLYLSFGVEAAVIAGDIGLMFMVNDDLPKLETWLAAPISLPVVIGTLMTNCKAWAPYYGISATLGAGGKVSVRYVKTVYMKATATAVPILQSV